jgi:hypothetical protein
VEAHRLQQYGQAIVADAYPLLLLLTQTAEAESLPLEWIENVATEFTALLALVDETWMSAKDEYVKSIIYRINLKCDNLDQLLMLLFHNISIRREQENVADLGSMLIPMSFMRHFKKEDTYPQQFWQASWVSVEKRYRHEKKNWALIQALIRLVITTSMTWFRTTTKKTLQQDALTLLDACRLHIHYEFNGSMLLTPLIASISWDKGCGLVLERNGSQGITLCLAPMPCGISMGITNL